MKNELQVITSATRQVRWRWFSVGGSPLYFLVLPDRKSPAVRPDHRLSADRFNQLHKESLQYITAELQTETTSKSVVVTHHVPTFMNYPEKYKGDALNEAFAVELFNLIETSGPDSWVFGHHHSNTPDFMIGKTQMLTNQLGYVKHGEHRSFNPEKSFHL